MVAITAGNELGLVNVSSGLPRGNTLLGQAGQSDAVYLNSTTGNLVIQGQDEYVSATGLDLALIRTYNSHGQFTDDNGDNWRLNVHQRLINLTGTVNTENSTATKVFGDAAEIVYRYDTMRGAYFSTAGEGAHDALSYNAASQEWTWIEGTTRLTETYNSAGQLTATRDADGNTTTYSYSGVLLTQITDASGQITYLDYSGMNLAQIRTVSQGVTQTKVRYSYDTSNRLIEVTVDLSPEDNSVADGRVYTTAYTYDDASARVTSITHSDGSTASFTYELSDGQYRVKTYTDGEGGTTTLTYISTAQTDITDPLGFVTSYFIDAQGRVVRILSPAVNGERLETLYSYDATGNLIGVTDANGRATVMEYDVNGNETLRRDNAGNTITRTYGAANQILTETRYAIADADGAGVGQPSEPLTTRYIYDVENHLRFIVSAEGRVVEHRYDAAGNRITTFGYTNGRYDVAALTPNQALAESELVMWAAAQNLTQLERVDYTYDFRGNVSTTTAYSETDATGTGVANAATTTRFIYDQRGLLLKTIDARGEVTVDPNDYVTTFIYDGLGRLLNTTQWIGKDAATGSDITRSTVTLYDDANRRLTVTSANGLATLSAYDRAGRLLNVSRSDSSQALGTTTYQYDANGRLRITIDPTGVKTYWLYDETGRLIATIDGTAALTETVYDKAGSPIQEIRYASRPTAAQLASLLDANGNPANITLASVRPVLDSNNDRILRNVYDSANRLVFVITPKDDDATQGFITQTFYDGADRVVHVIRYNNPISLSGLPATPIPADISARLVASSDDRRTRHFYDAEGKLLGTLDAEGYLREYTYDAAGRLTQTLHYANAAAPNLRTNGTFAELKTSVATSPDDQRSHTFYNGNGQLIASLDVENYLTEYSYDPAGNRIQEVRYATRANSNTGTQTLAQLRPAAHANDRVTLSEYNGANQLTQLTTNPQGTVTRYVYDNVGNLIRTDKAWNTQDIRTTRARYDALGRVKEELSGEGSAALEQLAPNAAPTQIDAIWAQWSIKHAYDSAGRRTATTDPNDNKTLYYYDEASRLRFSVNALGEVTEQRYNAFGEVVDTVRYSARISTTGLTGGLMTSDLTNRLATIASSRAQTAYTLGGLVKQALDELGHGTTYGYNAFGETITKTQQIDATANLLHSYSYDKRGLLTQTVWDPLGLNTRNLTQYDAFGRAISTTDGNANVRTQKYDKRGRVVETVDPLGGRRTTTYDAFDRVLAQTDALGQITTYTYNDAARSITTTTPEGVTVVTVRNRHGETVSVTDGNGNPPTTYIYDRNGNLKTTTDASGNATTATYDKADRRIEVQDAHGTKTAYTYDAANRIFTRTVDPAGLNLTTRYEYDAEGRTIRVTAPNGTVTETQYDAKGQTLAVIIDPQGLALKTQYAYDRRGRTLSVTEGAGTAAAKLTEYVYDGNDRVVYTIDALGGVTKNDYDANDRVIRTTAYAVAITAANLANLPDIPGVDDVTELVAPNAADETTGYVYGGGRLIYTVDALGGVTQKTYDANGNIVRTVAYASLVPAETELTESAVAAALGAGSANDRIIRTAYDALNRAVYVIDAAGYVKETQYDELGQIVKTIQHAQIVSVSNIPSVAEVQTALAPVTVAVSENSSEPHQVVTLTGETAVLSGGATPATQSVSLTVQNTTQVQSAIVKNHYWYRSGNAIYVNSTSGLSFDSGAPYNDTTPTEVRAEIYRDGALVATTYTDVGYYTYDSGGEQGYSSYEWTAVNNWSGQVNLTTGSLPVGNYTVKVYTRDDAYRLLTHDDQKVDYRDDTWTASTSFDVTIGTIVKPTYVSWAASTQPAGATVSFKFRAAGSSGAYTDAAVTLSGANHQADLGSIGAGNYEYVIEYADSFNRILKSATGTLTTTAAQTGTTTAAFNYTERRHTLRWSASVQPADTTPVFKYRPAGTSYAWLTIPMGVSGSDAQVVLDWTVPGDYEYTVDYKDPDGKILQAASGIFTVPANGGATSTVSFSHRETTLTWSKASQPVNTTAIFSFAPAGSSSFLTAPVVEQDGDLKVTLVNFDDGDYAYFVRYYNDTALIREAVGAVTVAANASATDVLTFIGGQNGADPELNAQVTTFAYDTAGRLVSNTDPFGFTEAYGYDAVGNKITFTNKKGDTWHYQYDADGRLTKEITPAVNVTRLQTVNGAIQPVTSLEAMTTVIAYDALGNVIARTEAFGAPEMRTTQYVYDAVGRQIQTVFPQENFYDPTQDQANNYAGRNEAAQIPISTTYYDALGNAYAGRDVAGHVSYKVYDTLGRVRYEIDAERYVTEYAYDAFGNQLRLTRYANRLSESNFTTREANANTTAIQGFTIAEVQALLTSSVPNRTVTNTYDLLNRTVESKQPAVYSFDSSAGVAPAYFTASPTTRNHYNAFGQVIQQSTLKNPGADMTVGTADDRWTDTYFYYDLRGEKTGEIDALGYLTTYAYDANGNLTEKTEYAKALAYTTSSITSGTYSAVGYSSTATVPANAGAQSAIGFDRTMRYRYDALNRKTEETNVNAQYADASYDGVATISGRLGNLTTRYTYDAVGNLTSVTDPKGATTRSYFDVLGRTTAVAEPARVIEGATPYLPPLTVSLTSVSWTGPADGSSVVQFRYRLASSDPWQIATVQAVGDQRVVNVSGWMAGNYQYEIAYFRPGETVAYLRGTGVLELNGLSTAGIPYVVDFVEPQSLLVNVSNAQWNDETNRWDSPSSVTLNWADLLDWGSGFVKVEVEYAEERIDGLVRAFIPPLKLTGEFSAEGSRHSVTLQKPISNISDPNEFALLVVGRVRVWKVVDGVDMLLFDRSGTGIGSERLILRGNTAGLTAIVVNGAQLAATHLAGDAYAVDVSALATGVYGYTTVGTAASLSGTFQTHTPRVSTDPFVQEKILSVNVFVPPEPPEPTEPPPEGEEPSESGGPIKLSWSPILDWGGGAIKVATFMWGGEPGLALVSVAVYSALQSSIQVGRGTARVQIYKVVNGVDVLLYDYAFGANELSENRDTSRLVISNLPAAAQSVVFQYRGVGDSGPYRSVSATRVASGWFAVDYKDIPNGQYEYKLLVRNVAGDDVDLSAIGGGADGTLLGTVQILRGAAAIPAVDPASSAGIVFPVTTFGQDIFGKVLVQTRHANGALEANGQGYMLGASDADNDQTLYRFYDRYGHKTREVAAEGGATYFSYDAAGNLRKEWMTVTDYDNGQQNRATLHDYNRVAHESATHVLTEGGVLINTELEYDAFGQITRRGVNGGREEYVDYDNAGRLWRTNQNDGVDTVYLYNLQGKATASIQSATLDLAAAQYAGPANVAMLTSEVRRTDNVLDALGRVVMETKPWFETVSVESTPQFAVDAFHRIGIGLGGSGCMVNLKWDSLARFGNGGVRVTIDFDSENGTGGFTQVYDSANADRGIDQSFNFRITRIDRVRVWKLVDGYDVLVHDRAGATVERNLTWRNDALPGSIVTLEYAKIGSDQWSALAVEERGNYLWVNVSSLSTDQYQYRVKYRHPDVDIPYRQKTGTFGVTGVTAAGATNIAAFTESARATVVSIVGNEVKVAWDSLAAWGSGSTRVRLEIAVNSSGLGAIINYNFAAVDSYIGATLKTGTSIYAVGRVQVWKVVNGTEVLVRDTAASADKRAVLFGNTAGVTGINVANVGTFNASNLGAGVYAATLGTLAAGHYRFTPLGGTAQASGQLVVGNVPAPQQTVVGMLTPTRSQIVDRWGNSTAVTDARGFTTEYRFDYANNVMREIKPRVSIWREDGTSYRGTPTASFTYDALGQLVASTDANGNTAFIQYGKSGERLAEYQADGGVVEHVYDALGREIAKIDANGYRTRMIYDRDNRVIEISRPLTTDRYRYNEASERIAQTNNANETLVYFYDTRGNLIKTRQPLLQEAYVAYDARGNKIAESWATVAGGPIMDSQAWTYDYFGRVQSHRDLGNRTYRYFYDEAGALTHKIGNTDRSVTGISAAVDLSAVGYDPRTYASDDAFRAAKPDIDQYLRYEYFHDGQLRKIIDRGTNTETRYEYDAAGNRVRETFVQAGNVFSDMRATYDSVDRAGWIRDNRYSMNYSYDAVGNRRRGQGSYREFTGGVKSFDNWYLYDRMNRVVVNAGSLVNGSIQFTSSQGTELSYDAAGNRRGARGYGFIDLGLRKVVDDNVAIGGAWGPVDERYFYDAEHRLIETQNASGLLSRRAYDAAGRLAEIESYSASQPGLLVESRIDTYNDNGWLTASLGFHGSGDPKYRTDYTFDAQGHVLNYTVVVFGANGYTNNYTYQYTKYDSYKEWALLGSSTEFVNGGTQWVYDVNGNLVQVIDQQKPQNTRTFVVDASGQILQNQKNGKVQNFYYFGGKPIGTNGQLAPTDFDFNYQPIGESSGATPGSYVVNTGDSLYSIALAVYGDGSLWYLIADANGIAGDKELFVGQTLRIPNVIANVHNNYSTFKPYNPGEIIGSAEPTMPMVGSFNRCAQVIVIIITVVVMYLFAEAGYYFAGGFFGSLFGQMTANMVGIRDGIDFKEAVIAGVASSLGQSIGEAFNLAKSPVAMAMIQSTVSQGLNIVTGRQEKFDWRAVATAAVATDVVEGLKVLGLNLDGTSQLPGFSRGIVNDFAKAFIKGAISQTVKHEIYDGGKFDWVQVAGDSFGNAFANGFERAIHAKEVDKLSKDDQHAYWAARDGGARHEDALKLVKLLPPTQTRSNDPERETAYKKALDQKNTREAEATARLVDLRRRVDALGDYVDNLDEDDTRRFALERAHAIFTAALVDKDVYFNQTISEILPRGVRRLDNDDLDKLRKGLSNERFQTEDGYFGALYKDTNRGTYLYANRGTDERKDWWHDIKQWLGFRSSQFTHAVEIGRELYDVLKGNVSFTGHSLGGALAAAQTLATHGRAITFNAAALSDGTKRRIYREAGSANKEWITALNVRGELLSSMLDSPLSSLVSGAYGTLPKNGLAIVGGLIDFAAGRELDVDSFGLALTASALGDRIEIPAINQNGPGLGIFSRIANSFVLHGIDSVLLSLQSLISHSGAIAANSLTGATR